MFWFARSPKNSYSHFHIVPKSSLANFELTPEDMQLVKPEELEENSPEPLKERSTATISQFLSVQNK